ncbi:phosphotransferase [Poseidonibacter lekithochrous]|uniref:phosphotransferase n=1 Tax=Poseidonibacter TaxID=2321187 RepID=UPI001C0A2072|nr:MULTISPECIES: phosphotransferase [Poseidonibacter]MBU3013962.1 phosphotransferase [Poseidonibacter lekithochrous]MDO6827257.1 phosphotransferase [Poseidonibacter sp. 1_MG-2023]
MQIDELKKYNLLKKTKKLKLEKLENQGVCNILYKIQTPEKNYILRVFKYAHTNEQSRKNEIRIQNKAFEKNIAAKVYVHDEKNSLMICDFLQGHHKEKLKKKDIKDLVKSLKKLHKIKIKDTPYKIEDDFKNYKKILKDKKSKQIIKASVKELKKIKKYKFEKVLCHHDLNQNNILFNKNIVKFIDWEFACVNDRFFDIANICFEFKLDKNEEKILLKKYLKKVKNKDIKKLASYKIVYKNLWSLWFKALKQS